MKKLILILVSIVLSVSFLSAAVLNLDSMNTDIRFFDDHGNLINANGLDLNYTAVTGNDSAVFTSEYGSILLYEKSAVTIGIENDEAYVYLIKGNAQLTNSTDFNILVKSPESRIALSPQGTALISTGISEESIVVINGDVVKTDIISGKETKIEDESIYEEQPVETEQAVEETVPEEHVEEQPVAVEPAVEPVVEPVVEQSDETEQVVEESVTEEPIEEQPVEVDQPVTEIKETVTGGGFSFGATAHVDIRNLKLDSMDSDCVRKLKATLQDAYWYAGVYVGYNSFRIALNANGFNTNPANYQFAEIPEDMLIPHFIKLGFSFINEIKYGSDGTLFSLRLDRNSDINFNNTAFGQMDHSFFQRAPLAFHTAVKTDFIGGNIFIDNLSLDENADINAGMRLSSSLLKNKRLTLGISAIALTEELKDYVLLPGADIGFTFVSNSKSKLDLILSGVADVLSGFRKFNAGAAVNLTAGPLKFVVGGDFAYGAFLSRIVDYGNKAYEIAVTNRIAEDEYVVNAYTDLKVELNKFYADLALNVPVKINGFSLYNAPVQDLSLKLGADLGKIKLFAAAKFDGLFYELAVPQTLSLENVLKRAEKLGAGAEFELGIITLTAEANYQNDSRIPVSLTLGLTANIGKEPN